MIHRRPLLEWKDRHRGETVLVCGCGASLSALETKPPCPVIGVNDMGRAFDPDYLVILNPKAQFPMDRFASVEATRAKAVFTSVRDLKLPGSPLVPIDLGKRGGLAVSPDGRVPFTRNSPYVALALARFMGATRIGLIGVDFTQHHFFGATGTHALSRELAATDGEYGRITAAAAKDGVEIVNLSKQSKLRSIPKADLGQFLRDLRPRRRVLHISQTNCAGAIWKMHKLMNKSGRLQSRVATSSPTTGGVNRDRKYPSDILWNHKDAFEAAIREADILHFHNFVDAKSPALRKFHTAMRDKPSVLQVHSEPAVVSPHFPGRDPVDGNGIPVLVIAQKQARFYPNATPVLNAVDPEDYARFPGAAAPAPGLPRIVYTPTDLADYPQTPPTCRGKGYRATRKILDSLAQQGLIDPGYGFDIDTAQLLSLMSGASARIDECVTGGYHLSSLEALAHGLATFAWLDPETRALLAHMTGSDEADLPWISTPIDALQDRLTQMARSESAFADAGDLGRAWMQKYWTAEAVLAPILSVYDTVATPPSRPVPKPTPKSIGPMRHEPLKLRSRDRRRPRRRVPSRSEDFAQTIHLQEPLLAAQGNARGKTVHVLGNGPSVAQADLQDIARDVVIGVNASILLQDRLGRPFDYYCVSDRRFLTNPDGRRMAEHSTSSTRVFAGYCAGLLPCDKDVNFVRILPGDGASFDILKGFHHGCSVVLFAAQLAGWLGAAEVRLHGMECDYSAGRFHESAASAQDRKHDMGIYPRVAKTAAAIAKRLADQNSRLTVAGPSRLTGSFGSSDVSGIEALPIQTTG